MALFRSVPLSFSQTVEPKLKSASMVRKMGAVYREDGLTNNEAEYLGLRSVLEGLPVGSSAEVLMDSMPVCSQFSGRYRVRDARMSRLLDEVRALIDQKRLTVKVTWIPRQQNLAGRLL